MAKKQNYIFAVGRRRTSVARVRLFHGKGESTVNTKPISKYFSGPINQTVWEKPFSLTETSNKYFISAKVRGGGPSSQLEAVVLGTARAFSKANPEKFRTLLKKAGLLVRDARIRQRRMVGMGGKSRRQRQSPKR
jgi:small subunit ribosomal protein S9